MTNIMTTILSKLISVDIISCMIAKLIAKLLKYASAKGGDKWDAAKSTIKQINVWTKLFVEVYEDDTLTAEEEQKIADAISQLTAVKKIATILKD